MTRLLEHVDNSQLELFDVDPKIQEHVDDSRKDRSMLFQIHKDSLTLIPENERVTNQDQIPALTLSWKVQSVKRYPAFQAYLG